MTTFTESMNLTTNNDVPSRAVELKARQDHEYYNTALLTYCHDNEVNAANVPNFEWDGALTTLLEHAMLEPEVSTYWFWLD